MSSNAAYGVRFTRSWVARYTGGLSAEVGDRRRNEIESDVYEQTREGTGGVLGRCLRGVPADLWWRVRMLRKEPEHQALPKPTHLAHHRCHPHRVPFRAGTNRSTKPGYRTLRQLRGPVDTHGNSRLRCRSYDRRVDRPTQPVCFRIAAIHGWAVAIAHIAHWSDSSWLRSLDRQPRIQRTDLRPPP